MAQMNSAGVMNSIGEFEKVFEDMEVTTEVMSQGMENVYQTGIDAGEVDNLL